MVGLLATAELPNLKEIFRDEDIGVCALHLVDEKIVIHSELFGRVDKTKLSQAREVSDAIDVALKERGVQTLYTWAGTDEQYRYNLFMGFKPTGKEVTFDGKLSGFFEFEKEL